MIQVDEHGNRFVLTTEGARVPLVPTSVNIKIETAMLDGEIVPVWDALAVERSLAQHWFAKYQAAQTTIADLHEQLQAKG